MYGWQCRATARENGRKILNAWQGQNSQIIELTKKYIARGHKSLSKKIRKGADGLDKNALRKKFYSKVRMMSVWKYFELMFE